MCALGHLVMWEGGGQATSQSAGGSASDGELLCETGFRTSDHKGGLNKQGSIPSRFWGQNLKPRHRQGRLPPWAPGLLAVSPGPRSLGRVAATSLLSQT